MNKIMRMALTNSLATGLYVVAVGTFMYYGSMVKIGKNAQYLGPIAMLLLFVFSAALTGYLVFGKPALLYLDGKKKDAVNLLTYTLSFLFVLTFVAIASVIFLTR